MKIEKEKWKLEKVWKRIEKNQIWIVIGVMKGGEWILYLEEEKKMIKDLVKGKEEKVEYLNVEIIKEKKYILGGMMREKV